MPLRAAATAREACASPAGAAAQQQHGKEAAADDDEPLAVAVLASAVGAVEIEDSEPPAHCCVSLPEPMMASPGGRHTTAAPPEIPSPDSLATARGSTGATGAKASIPRHRHRLQHGLRALRRYRAPLLLAVAVVGLLAGGSYACVVFRSELLEAGAYIRRHAPLSAVYYSLLVALWIVLCLPSTIIELAAGLIYSYPVAIVCLTVGKQLGCGIAFLIGRWITSPRARAACCCLPGRHHFDHDHEQQQQQQHQHVSAPSSTKRSRTVRAMFLALQHHPWQITFLIRLLPIPISLKNYGLALLPHCPFHIYMVTTLVAGLPFTVAWVYLGESCHSLLEALQGKGDGLKKHGGAYKQELGFLVTGLVVAVALVLLLRRYTRRYSRLLAEREAKAAAVAAATAEAAKAAAAAAVVAAGPRGLGERDVSTASSTTTALTLTPPSRAMLLALTDDEGEDDDDGEDEDEVEDGGVELEEGALVGADRLQRQQQRQRRRLLLQKRRRRRSSGSTSSGLSLDMSLFLAEEEEELEQGL